MFPRSLPNISPYLAAKKETAENEKDQRWLYPFLSSTLLSSKETVHNAAVLRAATSVAKDFGIKNFQPLHIMTDFEKGIINACAEIYPDAELNGCFFHMGINYIYFSHQC